MGVPRFLLRGGGARGVPPKVYAYARVGYSLLFKTNIKFWKWCVFCSYSDLLTGFPTHSIYNSANPPISIHSIPVYFLARCYTMLLGMRSLHPGASSFIGRQN